MTRQLLRRDERRAVILDAAAIAFARRGFAATSMTDVADEAGVTRILLYRHFDSKEALYRAVLDDVVDELGGAWQEHTDRAPARAAIETHLRVARSNPHGYRLLWSHAGHEPEFASYVASVRAVVSGMADDLLGEHLPVPLRAWAVASIVGYLADTVTDWLDHGDEVNDALFVARAAAGLRGLVFGIATGDGFSPAG